MLAKGTRTGCRGQWLPGAEPEGGPASLGWLEPSDGYGAVSKLSGSSQHFLIRFTAGYC